MMESYVVYRTYKKVDLILTCCVPVGVEVPIWVVAAREDSETNFGNTVVLIRASLRSADRTLVVRPAHIKLVEIRLVRCQVLRFNLIHGQKHALYKDVWVQLP